jgi:hypothetical protein
LLAQLEVVLAEGDRGVDQASALVRGDEVGEQDGVAAGAVVGDVFEGGLVGGPGDRLAGEAGEDLGLLSEHVLQAIAREDEDLVVEPCPDVGDLSARGHRGVRDQGPGGGGPDEQLVAVLQRRSGLLDRELHVDGGVLDVLVAEGDLMGGECGAVARAVGDDLVVLIEAPVVPHPAQGPPDRLDVVVGHRHVGVVQVDPEADALRQPVPVLDVAKDRLAAAGVELGDPEFLDLLLGADTELALDLQLDGKAVAVPAGLPRHLVSGHGLEARVDVLEHPGEDVCGVRPAVRRGRALVEAPERCSVPVRERAPEDVALAPALEDPFLERWE